MLHLLKICSKKGGTTIIPIILLFLGAIIPSVIYFPLIVKLIGNFGLSSSVNQQKAYAYVDKAQNAISAVNC